MGLSLPLEVLALGAGAPVTVLAHGVGGSITETRQLAGGLAGTRVLYAARGHGASPLGDEPVTYDLLARDLSDVAGDVAATRAVGVSMGAGSVLALLARHPDRFERVVLFLPASLDEPRGVVRPARGLALADALDARDVDAVSRLVAADVPADLAGVAPAYVRARSAFLLGSPGVAAVLRGLSTLAPVRDRELLRAVTADVLLLAQDGDPLHPASVARELAGLLPSATLEVFDRPGALLRERRRVRELVVGFLDGG